MRAIAKTGGGLLSSSNNLKLIVNYIKKNYWEKDTKLAIVTSAFKGVTSKLLEAAVTRNKSLIKEVFLLHDVWMRELNIDNKIVFQERNRVMNLWDVKISNEKFIAGVIASGEIHASIIYSAALNKIGIESKPHKSGDIGFITDNKFGQARLLEGSYHKMGKELKKLMSKSIPVITGFIGRNRNGDITTMKRQMSDFTATAFGNAITADEILIWKEVDGLYSADKKIVSDAQIIPEITNEEMYEFADFGYKVVHPEANIPAAMKDIPIRIMNPLSKYKLGTLVHAKGHSNMNGVKAISYKKTTEVTLKKESMMDATDFIFKVAKINKKYGVSLDIPTGGAVTISYNVDKGVPEEVIKKLSNFANVQQNIVGMIGVIGQGVKNNPEVPYILMKTLKEMGIVVRMESKAVNTTAHVFTVDLRSMKSVVKKLHENYFKQEK